MRAAYLQSSLSTKPSGFVDSLTPPAIRPGVSSCRQSRMALPTERIAACCAYSRRSARTLAGQYESRIEILQSMRPELRHASFLPLQINLHYSLREAPRLTQFRLAYLCIHLIRDLYEEFFPRRMSSEKTIPIDFSPDQAKNSARPLGFGFVYSLTPPALCVPGVFRSED